MSRPERQFHPNIRDGQKGDALLKICDLTVKSLENVRICYIHTIRCMGT